MAEPSEEITELLREANAADPAVREFAWVWLDAFRRDAADVLRRQRQEGRAEALQGGDLGAVRDRTEARLAQARLRLLGRLRRLLFWARDTGRSAGTGDKPPAES